jgi:hypothetical protein
MPWTNADDVAGRPISALRFCAPSLRRTCSTPRDARFARLELGLPATSSIALIKANFGVALLRAIAAGYM